MGGVGGQFPRNPNCSASSVLHVEGQRYLATIQIYIFQPGACSTTGNKNGRFLATYAYSCPICPLDFSFFLLFVCLFFFERKLLLPAKD